MSVKKLVIAVFCLILIVFIVFAGYFILAIISIQWLPDGNDRKGEQNITTSLGDEFLLSYTTSDFPEYETSTRIMDVSSKKILGFYNKPYSFTKPTFIEEYNSKALRIYEVEGNLIYRLTGREFKGICIECINEEKVEENTELVVALKALVEKKEWKWIKACGGFLVKAGDSHMRETLKRYAAGQFTEKEIDQNKNSEISRKEIIEFSMNTLGYGEKPTPRLPKQNKFPSFKEAF